MNISKWLPKQHYEVIKLFDQTRALEREFRVLGKKFATDINLDLPDYYVSMVLLGGTFIAVGLWAGMGGIDFSMHWILFYCRT